MTQFKNDELDSQMAAGAMIIAGKSYGQNRTVELDSKLLKQISELIYKLKDDQNCTLESISQGIESYFDRFLVDFFISSSAMLSIITKSKSSSSKVLNLLRNIKDANICDKDNSGIQIICKQLNTTY